MTDLLKDMLTDRADALDAPQLDVAAMVRDGDRQAARRRNAVVGLGAAAAVVTAIAVPQLLPQPSQTAREFSYAAAFEAGEPSYAVGSRVTVDGHTFDTGHQVHAMVQTTEGVVFTDEEGVVRAADGEETTRIGQSTTSRDFFALETDGSLVAWIEERPGRGPIFTAFDQATGETKTLDYVVRTVGTEYSPDLWAVDGDDVWLRDDRGVVRWNVATGEQTELGAPRGLEIHDVKAGVIAYEQQLVGQPETPLRFSRDGSVPFGGAATALRSEVVTLSPDGATALGEDEPDHPALADTSSGQVTPLEVPEGYGFFTGYGWADADTFVGLGLNQPWDSTPADLLTCEVGGACRVTAEDVGTQDGGLVIPVGRPMDD